MMGGQRSAKFNENPFLIKRQSSLTANISNGFTLKNNLILVTDLIVYVTHILL